MSTRCDFYDGRGLQAAYRGSIGRDGFPHELSTYFKDVSTKEAFEVGIQEAFEVYGGINPDKGWPWPWKDSHTTDVAIAFDAGRVWVTHHSGRWAPLNDLDNPGDEKIVFPDMAAAEEAIPEGRLRRQLRYSADLALGPNDDPLTMTLFRATLLLARAALHMFERDGQYYVLTSFGFRSRASNDLFDLRRALCGSPDYAELLAARKARHQEPEWELLDWLTAGPLWVHDDDVQMAVTPDMPFYFGLPLPETERLGLSGPVVYARAQNPENLRQALDLQELMLSRAPSFYSLLLTESMLDFGVLPVPRAEADAWMSAPQAELGNQPLDALCASAEGRATARRYAWSRVFEIPFDLEPNTEVLHAS